MEKRIIINKNNKEKFIKEADEHIENTDKILAILNERLSKITGKDVKLVNVNREYKKCILDLAEYLEQENILFFNSEFPFSEGYLESFNRMFSVYDKLKNLLITRYNKAVESVTSEEVINGKLSQVVRLNRVGFVAKKELQLRIYSLNMLAKAVGSYSFEKYIESNEFRTTGINRYSNVKGPVDGKYNYNRRLLEEDTALMGKTCFSSAFDEWGRDFYSAALDMDRKNEEKGIKNPKEKEYGTSN